MTRALLMGNPPEAELGYRYVREEPYDAVVIGSLSLGQLLYFREEQALKGSSHPWIEPTSLVSPALLGRFFGSTREARGIGQIYKGVYSHCHVTWRAPLP